MKKMRMMSCIVAFSLVFGLAGCNNAEVKSLQEELAKTIKEKESIEAKMHVVTQARDELQGQVKELIESRDQLQTKVAELDSMQKRVDTDAKTIAELKGQIEKLTQSRDVAAAEAQAAQVQINDLAKKLEAETEKVRVLQEQLKQVQAAIAELQNSIKL
ncbi:MAG: hypothetical protein JXM79_22895 [Sedimentisphaerales bacterium]|nr:hypothetical protein [Sedimentisphaerales bacterium]